MSTLTSVISESPAQRLASGLHSYRLRAAAIAVLSVALWTGVTMLIGILAAMWLDLVWPLSVSIRWTVSRVWPLAAIAGGMAWGLRQIGTIDNDSVSDRIDQFRSTGGEILTGWQLSSRQLRPAGALTQGMAAIAADRAYRLLNGCLPADVFPLSQCRRAAQVLVAIVVASFLIALAAPTMASTQWSRFLTPTADVPPYTGVQIELILEPSSILYGQDVVVVAEVSSSSSSRLQLVTLTDSGVETVIPMLASQSISGSSARDAGDRSPRRWQTYLTRVTEPLNLYARDGKSRSLTHRLEVQMTPQILPPTVRIIPPAYTGAAAYQGIIPRDGLSGLPGTEVQWRVTSNRPLAEGRLRMRYRDGAEERVVLQPLADSDSASAEQPIAQAAESVAGTTTLQRPGTFELSVVDIDGIESHETIEGTITILQDQRPVVRIVSPRPVSLATPDIELPVTVSAEDDYGITSLALFRSLNGSPARPLNFEIDGAARQEVQIKLPLNQYSLSPGDEIQLFARVEDNDPAGYKGAESPVTMVRIISVREFQEMAVRRQGAESIQAKYEAARRHFETLAEALREATEAAAQMNETPDDRQAGEALREKLEAARKAASQAADALEAAAKQALPIDVDQALSKRLAEQAELARQMANELGELAASSADDQQPLNDDQLQQLQQMLESAAANRQKLQDEAIDPLGNMQKMLPLLIDQQRFVQLTEQQRDLANRLNSLRDSVDPQDESVRRRIADLESEQQRLREALDELLDDIQNHSDQLPDDPELENLRETAQQFVDELRASEALPRMASTQQHLLGGQLQRSRDDATAAADILESFLSKCDAMGEGACENCKAGFSPSLSPAEFGNSIEQLLAMMGMKPGTGRMGSGLGYGLGSGFAQRAPGPENIGMYGALPMVSATPASGQGDSTRGGTIARTFSGSPGAGNAGVEPPAASGAGGQAVQAIPRQYRSQVAEYFRRLAEEMPE